MLNTSMPDETMRAEFERWYEHDFMGGLDSAGEFDAERNCYVVFQVHMAWKGWQASRASAAPGGEPVAWQWRRKGEGWTLAKTFNSQVFATTDDSEVRALYAGAPPSEESRPTGWPEVDSYVFPRKPLQTNGVWVKRARQLAGPDLWKVTNGLDDVLNVHGQWEFEPSPSSRDDEFLARCRFPTAEAAIRAAISESEGSSNG